MRAIGLILVLGACADGPPTSSDDTDDVAGVDALAPEVTCAPDGGCGGEPVTDLAATSRPDFAFPYGTGVLSPSPFGTDDAPTYPETGDAPGGRRVTVVGRALVSGSLLIARPSDGWGQAHQLFLDGRPATTLLDEHRIDWVRVWPTTFQAGDPVWVMFHERAPLRSYVSLRVPSTSGDAIVGEVGVKPGPVVVTWVAPTHDLGALQVHVHNDDTVAHTLGRVIVDGEDVTASACVPTTTVAPGTSLLLTVPRCAPSRLGAPFTVVVEVEGAPPGVAAGRVLKPLFPLHAWPRERFFSSGCPHPGGDYALGPLVARGYDTLFAGSSCTWTEDATALDAKFRSLGAWAVVDASSQSFTDTTRVLARSLGEDVDDTSGIDALVTSGLLRAAADGSSLWTDLEPGVATYVAGRRHRYTGLFAGTTDVQGMAMAVGACAPHVTDAGVAPPLRATYDYVRAARADQLPLPVWADVQGFGDGPAQPTPSEIRVQALSAVAAGAKGLLTSRAQLDELDAFPASWQALADVNRDVDGVRHLLREGDPTGMARVRGGRALAEAIRVPGGVIVVVVGLDTDQGPDDLACRRGEVTPWVLADQEVDVDVDLPPDLGLDDLFEVRAGAIHRPTCDVGIDGRTVHLQGIQLDDDVPGRILVLASEPGLRADVRDRLR